MSSYIKLFIFVLVLVSISIAVLIIDSSIENVNAEMPDISDSIAEGDKNYNESIRKRYARAKKKGKIPEDLEKAHSYLEDDFFKLAPEFQLSNLRQARSIPKKLNLIGCEIAPKKDPRHRIGPRGFGMNNEIRMSVSFFGKCNI